MKLKASKIPQLKKKKSSAFKKTLFVTPELIARRNPIWVNYDNLPDPLIVKTIDEYLYISNGFMVSVPALPISSNKMLSKTKWGIVAHPDLRAYKELVKEMVKGRERTFESVLRKRFAAVLIFESAKWMNADGSAKKMDVDNRIKPMMDAMTESCGGDDSNAWQVTAFKLLSKEDRTTLFLFSLESQPINQVRRPHG